MRDGSKTSTIRLHHLSIEPGRLTLFSSREAVEVNVTRVRHTTLGGLTEEDARRENFPSLEALKQGLHGLYHGLHDGSPMTVIEFEYQEPKVDFGQPGQPNARIFQSKGGLTGP